MNDFNELLGKVASIVKKQCGIDLGQDYDAVMVKPMAATNIIRANKKSKQTHIAITGPSRDMFPYIDISNYSSKDGNNNLKLFYILQVPFHIFKKNIDAISTDASFDYNEQGIATVTASVKMSKHGDDRQIELGNPTQSSEGFVLYRTLFEPKDLFVVLKREEKIEYDTFIIRKRESDGLTTEFAMRVGKTINTFVDSTKYKSDEPVFKGGHNIIYYGAPGTGKSYRVSEEIKHDYIADYSSKQGSPDVFRATLHPEYSYSDFVGQLLPKVEQERVTYEFTPGVFTSALKHAISYPMRPTFLILEEMSRANVAAVFGDIFQLLDRDEDGRSEYTINNGLIAQNAILSDADGATDPNSCSVYLPENLFIVGTVNTSDQNVFAMDTAFKRRFTWEYVSPKVDEASFENNPDIEISSDMTVSWYKLYTTLNDFITRDLGLTEDKQIGPYFIKFGHSQMNPEKLVKDKLLQYLWEDVDVVARRMNGGARSLFDSKIASFADLYDSFGQKTVFSNKFIEKLKGSASNDSLDESDDVDGSERAED
ncbi:McrB family protein [Limosilactobacillus reuteri subsp. suis]|uniref:McrB family protein n=1 Tax=Limosilactobacillus reuteri TaxID=1598 RepID=UPI003993B4B6